MTRASGVLFGILVCAVVVPNLFAKNLPNYDASVPEGKSSKASFAPREKDKAKIKPGSVVQVDESLGIPTFLWAARRKAAGDPSPALGSEAAARQHLVEYASLYNLEVDEARGAIVRSIHDNGRGAVIVTFRRAVDGVEVFRDEVKVAMDRGHELVAIAGHLTGRAHVKKKTDHLAFALGPEQAIAAALVDCADVALDPRDFEMVSKERVAYELFDLKPGAQALDTAILNQPARVKKTVFRLPDHLEPAWYVEIDVASPSSQDSDLYSYVISATDGRLLFRNDLTATDSFSYRVWADAAAPFLPFDGPQGVSPTPHPTGTSDGYQAPFVPPALVTLQNGPIGTNDPWLPPGASVTTGNNAEAYADLAAPDGFSTGDVRATTTASNTFDRIYDTSRSPQVSADQERAAITQLFYDVNFFHDWYYDAGFDEASGNAQQSNYGRGGLGGDSLKAEAQDSSGYNNANMSTPADGARPRMQMYLWDANGRRSLTVNSPAAIAGQYATGIALFGPSSFNITNAVVLVNDGSTAGTGGTATDGCQTPFSNAAAISGRIALLDRGVCNFTVKVKNAQLNGAIGVLVANNQATGLFTMTGTDATITIPSLCIAQNDGNTIRGQLGTGVNAALLRDPAADRDGTIDNQIVAHEWGHFISNRLIGDANGLDNNQGGALGEGWGDFHALLMTVRPEDAFAAANPGFSGAYALAGYSMSGGANGPLPNNGYYFGLRRYPYSTDLNRNPLTFRHIANGVPMPGGPPIAFGWDGTNNAEVHNSGEVWATMLWECYASLLRDASRLTFDQARDRMRDYLVAAYKLTPSSPTYIEARDAVLAAAYAGDPADALLFSQAFARRGAGVRAVAPDRYSTTHAGVVESYIAGNDLIFESAALDDGLSWCDRDGYLDANETGRLAVTLRNVGAGALSSTTGTVVTSASGLSFPNGAHLVFPPSQPSGTTTAFVDVGLAAVTGVKAIDFTISFGDTSLAIAGTIDASVAARGNLDDVPARSATDDVESGSPAWALGSAPGLGQDEPWRRIEITGRDHRWLGPDPHTSSDQYLISPPLAVAPTGSFSLTFRHRYSFEFITAPTVQTFDGGVVEISTDGGATWNDVGGFASPGYNGVIAAGGGNPIEGRSAFTQTSPGYPGFVTATVSLGAAYAGRTVRIRFRLGADVGGSAAGWEIDDIVFSNITNLPFNALVDDRAQCLDSDSDGTLDLNDCAPLNASTWAPPGEARDLRLSGGTGTTQLDWTAPSSPGGTAIVYDTLRSVSASSFATATCIESNGTDVISSDPAFSSGVFFYLVRPENACGGNLGADSSGRPRTGGSCP